MFVKVSVLVVVCIVVASMLVEGTLARGSSLRLKKQANRVDVSISKKVTMNYDRKTAGKSIPMNGGILTLGAYFTQVTVGTGAAQQTFDAIVDTGSSNTAIPSAGCDNCQTTALYNASLSPTAFPLECGSAMCQNCVPTAIGSIDVPPNANTSSCPYGRPQCDPNNRQCRFSISYGGSSSATAGTTVMDVACLGGVTEKHLCALSYVNQILEQYPSGTQPTGIVGFAFPANACNPTCQPTILDSLVAGGALSAEENMFGMCLDPINGGTIDLGAINTTRYYGPLMYTPIVSEEWFNIRVRDIVVNGVSIGVPEFFYSIRNDAIGSFVDSGTGILLVSPFTFQVIQQVFTTQFSTLEGVSQLFDSQCVTFTNATAALQTYPQIGIVVAGSIGQPDFTLTIAGSNYVMPSSVPAGPTTPYCLGIQGVPSIGVIIGDIVMENYYIVFDRFNKRLGFAPQVGGNCV